MVTTPIPPYSVPTGEPGFLHQVAFDFSCFPCDVYDKYTRYHGFRLWMYIQQGRKSTSKLDYENDIRP